MIDSFKEEYAFLSNFYDCPVTYDGLTYRNSEAAFQAQKTEDEEVRKQFTTLPPNKAKYLGRNVKLREDWELIKDVIMYGVCKAKFSNEELKEKLLATGNEELIEGTTWHDNYWGNCTCEKCKHIEGKNRLGKTLMAIREELRDAEE